MNTLNKLPPLLLGAMLSLLAIAAYLPSLQNGLVWDAEVTFLQDPTLQDFTSFVKDPASLSVADGLGSNITALKYFRPLTRIVHYLEFSAFGSDPFGYKLVSLLLHALIVFLLFRLVLSIQGDPVVAFWAIAIYAVKPIHAEAVSWTYSVSYLLTAMFAVSALLCYRRQRPVGVLLYLCALASHEYGILLFPVLFVHRWLLEPGKGIGHFKVLLPYLLMLLLFMLLRTLLIGGVPLTGTALLPFINTAAVIVKKYLQIFFWPEAPVTFYLARLYAEWTLEVVLSYLMLAGLLGLAWLGWISTDRRPLFWGLWFFIWLATTFNIGRLGDYLLAEKLIYLASVGPSVLLVLLLRRIFCGRSAVVAGLAVLYLVAQLVMTWQRQAYWQDTETFIRKGLEFAPQYVTGRYALAGELIARERYDEALQELLLTVSYDPNHSPAHNNIANIHYLRGNLPQALNSWRNAIKYDDTNPLPHYNMGMVLERMGQRSTAKRSYLRYLELAPDAPPDLAARIRSM